MNMKKIFIMCMGICIISTSFAQQDTSGKKNSGQKEDTIKIGGITIIKKAGSEKKAGINISTRKKMKPSNTTTNWWVVDLGFSNVNDNTDYSSVAAQQYGDSSINKSWFDQKTGKSVNINLWFVIQRLNMIEHIVNLKYGLGLELNNYRYKQPIRYNANPPAVATPQIVMLDNTPNRSYDKNKLAADYITVPLMINFNFTPRRNDGFGFSAGISAGFLYSARNKTITSDEGKEKAKDDFELERWKISYIGELFLGPVKLYGSYATRSMYERGLDMIPYNIGIRFSN